MGQKWAPWLFGMANWTRCSDGLFGVVSGYLHECNETLSCRLLAELITFHGMLYPFLNGHNHPRRVGSNGGHQVYLTSISRRWEPWNSHSNILCLGNRNCALDIHRYSAISCTELAIMMLLTHIPPDPDVELAMMRQYILLVTPFQNVLRECTASVSTSRLLEFYKSVTPMMARCTCRTVPC